MRSEATARTQSSRTRSQAPPVGRGPCDARRAASAIRICTRARGDGADTLPSSSLAVVSTRCSIRPAPSRTWSPTPSAPSAVSTHRHTRTEAAGQSFLFRCLPSRTLSRRSSAGRRPESARTPCKMNGTHIPHRLEQSLPLTRPPSPFCASRCARTCAHICARGARACDTGHGEVSETALPRLEPGTGRGESRDDALEDVLVLVLTQFREPLPGPPSAVSRSSHRLQYSSV